MGTHGGQLTKDGLPPAMLIKPALVQENLMYMHHLYIDVHRELYAALSFML